MIGRPNTRRCEEPKPLAAHGFFKRLASGGGEETLQDVVNHKLALTLSLPLNPFSNLCKLPLRFFIEAVSKLSRRGGIVLSLATASDKLVLRPVYRIFFRLPDTLTRLGLAVDKEPVYANIYTYVDETDKHLV